ncbi:nuclear transport factor 2 family protein [Pedobacter sp. AW1-32]|uniref:nuclear transport factor 2 family protein n=1 Tax=Pedobacter sp. AW1-32 TaxID=3383026 RepID=UPI003FEF0B9B
MKKLLIAVALLFTSVQFCAAQKPAVENAVNMLTKIMINPDSISLENLVLDELSYGHSTGKIQTKRQFIHSLLSGESDFVDIDLSDQEIIIQNKTALVRHTLSAKTNDNHVAGNVKLFILLIWTKEKGGWKLLGRQAIKVPQ